MKEILNDMLTDLVLACILAGVATGVICYIFNAFVRPFIKGKMLVKARQEGHEIVARRIKTIYPKGAGNGKYDNKVKGVYQYEYNGKTYRYSEWSPGTPINEKRLYFRRNPAKATDEVHFGKVETEKWVIFIVCVAVAMIIL